MSNVICQVLNDVSASNRKRDWALHKIHNTYISMAYEEINPRKAERMKDCANWLAFLRGGDGTLKLHDARFCRVRLCPICQWRRALKTFAQMSQVLEIARAEGYEFVFLTLTQRNCDEDNLSDDITRLLLAFNRLTKYKEVRTAIKGFYRGCEVTHNVKEDTYHPHLHVILAVRSSYFGGSYYLSQKRWTELWQKALQSAYVPIVDIRRCKGGIKAIAEACKYAVKPSDIISLEDWDLTVKTLGVLDAALENRRFVGLGGVLKEIHKNLHLDDIEDGDLLHIETESEQQATQEEIIYFWNGYNRYEL